MYRWLRAARMQPRHRLPRLLHCCPALDQYPHEKSHFKAVGAEGTRLPASPRLRDRQRASRSMLRGIVLIQMSNSEIVRFLLLPPKKQRIFVLLLVPTAWPGSDFVPTGTACCVLRLLRGAGAAAPWPLPSASPIIPAPEST